MKRIENELENVPRLTREERKLASNLSDFEVRCLVSNYYQSQSARKRSDQQIAVAGDKEPSPLAKYMADSFSLVEDQIKAALGKAVEARPVGRWLLSIYGIGPVIAAGLLAHIDINRATTAGAIWRFAGLDPTVKWEKGCKRPWNTELKTICWHAGQGFMKLGANPLCTYGALYRTRKAYEVERNESGGNADTAKALLEAKRFAKTTEAFKHLTAGKLPPAQIDARARRYAVKIFLSHLHLVWRWLELGELPAKPYAISHLGHAHELIPPGLDLIPGLADAMRGRMAA